MSSLVNRAIQISGSSSPSTCIDHIEYTHLVVKNLVNGLLKGGATIVTIVGSEPRAGTDEPGTPSIVFYWSVLEAVMDFSKSSASRNTGHPLARIVCSERSEREIPVARSDLWKQLVHSRSVALDFIPPGWNSNSIKRRAQERRGDALVVIGGGAGVEESIHLYVSHGKPVLPLDIPLGCSSDDGTGGAPEMLRWARTHPRAFFPNISEEIAAGLSLLKYGTYTNSPKDYANAILDFLSAVVRPQVFCARLADEDTKQFADVDTFFGSVVRPALSEMGYVPIEIIGKSPIRSSLIDIEIFKQMNRSPYSVVDLTGLRPSCCIELGYLLGSCKRTIVTAARGTKLPFDVKTLPCTFWDPKDPAKSTTRFHKDWAAMIDRPYLSEINESIVGIRDTV